MITIGFICLSIRLKMNYHIIVYCIHWFHILSVFPHIKLSWKMATNLTVFLGRIATFIILIDLWSKRWTIATTGRQCCLVLHWHGGELFILIFKESFTGSGGAMEKNASSKFNNNHHQHWTVCYLCSQRCLQYSHLWADSHIISLLQWIPIGWSWTWQAFCCFPHCSVFFIVLGWVSGAREGCHC